MRYDPAVIIANAEGLIRQRVELTIVRTVNHLAIGFVIGVTVALIFALLPLTSFWREVLSPALLMAAPTLILGGIGFLRAYEEAKELRFRAHMLLCQVEIERHLSALVASAAHDADESARDQ